MKTLFVILVASASLMGCLPAVDGKNFYLSEHAKSKISSDCEKLRSIGEYRGLRDRINRDTAMVKELIKRDDLEEIQDQVKALGKRIRDDSEQLVRLTDSPYVQIDRDQRLRWILAPQELGIQKKGQLRIWHIVNVTMESAFNWRGEDVELLEHASLKFDRDNIQVKFQRPASALELCQLQQTLVIVLKVDFRGALGQRKTMHYNLLAQNVRK